MLLRSGIAVPDGPGWLHEVKYDGYRMLAQWGEEGVFLKTRNGTWATEWFPEVADSLRTLVAGSRGPSVVDGEICVLDEHGRSDFDRLRARAAQRGLKRGSDRVVFCVFDLLVLRGRSLLEQPLALRKAELMRLLGHKPDRILPVQGVLDEGTWLFAQAQRLGLEGIVSKKTDSRYLPGQRSPSWVKRVCPGAKTPGTFRRGPSKPWPGLGPAEE